MRQTIGFVSRTRGLHAFHCTVKQLACTNCSPARHQVSLDIRISFDESFNVLQDKDLEFSGSLSVLPLTDIQDHPNAQLVL